MVAFQQVKACPNKKGDSILCLFYVTSTQNRARQTRNPISKLDCRISESASGCLHNPREIILNHTSYWGEWLTLRFQSCSESQKPTLACMPVGLLNLSQGDCVIIDTDHQFAHLVGVSTCLQDVAILSRARLCLTDVATAIKWRQLLRTL